jgi:hypothetical protein
MQITETAARQIANALKLAKAAQAYADALKQSRGQYTGSVEYLEFELCNAAIDVADDGDFLARRNDIATENGWDAEGYPVDDYGNPLDPDTAVHVCAPDGSWSWQERAA